MSETGNGWRKFASASGANLAMQIFAKAFGLGMSLFLVRQLGASNMGIYAFALATSNVLLVFSLFGLDRLAIREIAVSVETSDWGRLRGTIRWGRANVGVISLGLAAVAFSLMTILGTFETRVESTTTLLALLLLLLAAQLSFGAAVLRGLGAVVLANVGPFVLRPVSFGCAAGVMVLAMGGLVPETAMVAHCVGVALAAAGSFALGSWKTPSEVRKHDSASFDVRGLMVAAAPLVVLAGLGAWNRQADILMLKTLSTSATTGIYSIAAQFAALTGIGLTVVNGVLAPRLAQAYARGDTGALQTMARHGVLGAMILTIPACVGLATFGPYVFSWYGDDFVNAYPFLLVLMAGQVVNALCGSVGYMLLMAHRELVIGMASLASALVNISLNLALVPQYGGYGAAIATAVSVMLWNVSLSVYCVRQLRVDPTILGWLRRGVGAT